MANKRVSLHYIPGMMLIIEHPSGVRYLNQVGGVVNAQEEMEGVLAPLDISEEAASRIEAYPYPQGRQGLSSGIATMIDDVLASEPGTRFLRVDRTRLDESWEAWVHVRFHSPDTDDRSLVDPYFGEAYGFGAARGVLTWCNSD